MTDAILTEKLLPFLDTIGLAYRFTSLPGTTFLPGLDIASGVLLIDTQKLLYPGDILHEAGHIAVTPSAERAALSGNAGKAATGVDGEEIAAILWSYAALRAAGLPEEVVFHPQGYKGQSDWHIENFRNRIFPGLPLLEWMGMTLSEERAAENNTPPFPHMIRWLRE